MKKRILTPLLFAALMAGSVSAQSVLLRGKVENVSNGGFVLDCTAVQLQSTTVNLRDFVGLNTEIQGKVVNMSPKTVQVDAIKTAPRVFEIGGNRSIGREFSLDVSTMPGTLCAVYVAGAAGFAPMGGVGTVLLDNPLFLFAGVVPQDGMLQRDLPIPNDSKLVGFMLHGQALLIDKAGFSITNNSCKTVRS